MKLEIISEHGLNCPLIRLREFTLGEAAQLRALVAGLATNACQRVEVHRLPFVEAAGGCKLALVSCSWDQGMICSGEPTEFECGFTSGTWDNVVGLIEPLTQNANGFQWIAGSPGETGLLMSRAGDW